MLYDRQKKQVEYITLAYTRKKCFLNAFIHKRYIVSYCFDNGLNCFKNREKQYIIAIAAAGNIINQDAGNIPVMTIISIILGMYAQFINLSRYFGIFVKIHYFSRFRFLLLLKDA